MTNTLRQEPVVEFPQALPPGDLRDVVDMLTAVLGKVTSNIDITLMTFPGAGPSYGGSKILNAPVDPGVALDFTRNFVDFADAGVDNVRVVARAANSTAGSIVLQVWDVTYGAMLCDVTVTGTTPTTYRGDWTALTPLGPDQEIELRVIGDGVMDLTLWTVHLQGRTTQKRV